VLEFISIFHNAVDYPLRQLFRWHRKNLNLQNEDKTSLFSDIHPSRQKTLLVKLHQYLEDYDLGELFSHSTQRSLCENIYYLELFLTAFQNTDDISNREIQVADIGVADWFYVRTLLAFLKNFPAKADRGVTLDGYEIDAYRVYQDAFSRIDYAMAYTCGLENVRFRPEAFQPQPHRFDLIFMLFPFVFVPDHLRWGLPIRLFAPLHLLENVWVSIKPNGFLVVANQGQKEHEQQMQIMKKVGIRVEATFLHESEFYKYPLPRFVIIAKK
jgi:hypothetical protein